MAAPDLVDAQTFENMSFWGNLERVLSGRCYMKNIESMS